MIYSQHSDLAKNRENITSQIISTFSCFALHHQELAFTNKSNNKHNNFTGKCGNPPPVENGYVNESENTGKREATVYCKPGYGTGNHQKITCDDNGEWEPGEPCYLTGCGQLPSIPNGRVIAKEISFNSTAKIDCNNGFMVNNTVDFKCLTNGSWASQTEAECFPHPCGPYTLPGNVIVSEDLSHINMSVILQCDEGFVFKQNSDKLITCDNNTWTGRPECEIPGRIYFIVLCLQMINKLFSCLILDKIIKDISKYIHM